MNPVPSCLAPGRCPSRSCIHEEAGFTLIELLTVTVLLALLSSILYGSISAVLNGREIVTAQRETTLAAEHIFSQLASDLVAREAIPLEQQAAAAASTGGSGFSGFGVRRYMTAKNESKQNAHTDSLSFVTHSFPIAVVSQVHNFGMVEVSYRLEEVPRNLRLEQQSATRYRLLREERPAAVRNKETRAAHQVVTILADNVVDFNLRFMLNEKWQDEWTGTSGRAFPEAIELTLGLLDSEEVVHRFRTAVAVSKRQK